MQNVDCHRRRIIVPMLVIVALFLAACGADEAFSPPAADVAGIQTIALFPLENETDAPELGTLLTERIEADLQAFGWYDVIGPDKVAAHIAEQRLDLHSPTLDDEARLDLARAIADDLGADGFIDGHITAYSVAVTATEPELTSDGAAIAWHVEQTTQAHVALRGRLVNAHTGTIVYDKEATGTGATTHERALAWVAPEQPPANLVPAVHRRDVPEARARAIDALLDAFTRDILPQRVADE